jgi:6-pyruvoyltetrahydropterin/6-carboxytetrahydropterin synthase
MNISLSRTYNFSAAHRLNSPDLDELQNVDIYDKCNNINGHGHDYTLIITLKGTPHKDTGMIIPLPEFDKIAQEVIELMDYKHLDKEVDFFKVHISTAENIIQFLWTELESRLPTDSLYYIKLWETNNNYFELGKELVI